MVVRECNQQYYAFAYRKRNVGLEAEWALEEPDDTIGAEECCEAGDHVLKSGRCWLILVREGLATGRHARHYESTVGSLNVNLTAGALNHRSFPKRRFLSVSPETRRLISLNQERGMQSESVFNGDE